MDPVERLRAALDEEARIALAASRGPWRGTNPGQPDFHDPVVFDADDHVVADQAGWGTVAEEDMLHMIRQDPKATLDRIAALRALLDDIVSDEHADNQNSYYICPARVDEHGEHPSSRAYEGEEGFGVCTCGRDERVERRLQIIARMRRIEVE